MLTQLLLEKVKKYPDNTAIAYANLKMSYKELYSQVKGLSHGLNSIGIKPGDCIALVLPNCPEFIVSFYAAAQLNAIVLPLNHLFKQEEISYYISDSNARLIITDTKRAEMCRHVIDKIDKEIELIVVDRVYPSARYFYDLIVPEVPENYDNPTDCFTGDILYQYSSGSTGRPKKVCRTQHNLYHEVKNFTETANITSADKILCLVPLYHAHGLGNCLLAATCNGATLVILEQVLQKGNPVEVAFVFRRPRVLELIEKEQITILPGVPYIFNTLAETPVNAGADLSSLRLCFSAGNFLPKDIFDKFLHRLGIPVRQLYGCTEAGSVAINLSELPETISDSVGSPLNNVEIKIVNDSGNELPAGAIGEVVIGSKALTSGYYNMPEVNQQAFQNGYFFTGDLGKKDESGCIYITGRKKILIDTGGYKVDPIEIEDILVKHPEVKEAVVVGVNAAFTGEVIKAVIVPKSRGICNDREILSYCQERLAEFKVPKIVEFREEIPKSPLGKILRKELI